MESRPPWIQAQDSWQPRIKTPLEPITHFSTTWQEHVPASITDAKSCIAALEASKRWELVKKMVNPYEIVYTHEDPLFHPSISIIKPLSRSYFKMIEMLSVLQFFERLPKQQPKVRSAHVAEGPGGFIQAVVDVCQRNRRILENATAMTLKSSEQHVPGWRRAAAFLFHNKEVRLHYGKDNTGNVYSTANQESFVATVKPGAHLFTADGGFDFSVNYDFQEQNVFRLLICSSIIGLKSLIQDGCFVLKLFDIFSEHTKVLLALLARCFKEWSLYKPALSRPCNSERYFLGRGYIHHRESIDALVAINGALNEGKYPLLSEGQITTQAAEYIETHVTTTTGLQVQAIKKAEEYANHPEVWYKDQLSRDFLKSKGWCEQFRIACTQREPSPAASLTPFSPVLGANISEKGVDQ